MTLGVLPTSPARVRKDERRGFRRVTTSTNHLAPAFALGFMTGLALACMFPAMQDHAAQAARPTPESATSTRHAMHRDGLGHLLTPSPKPTADQRRAAEQIRSARALGFVRGRFVGGAA